MVDDGHRFRRGGDGGGKLITLTKLGGGRMLLGMLGMLGMLGVVDDYSDPVMAHAVGGVGGSAR